MIVCIVGTVGSGKTEISDLVHESLGEHFKSVEFEIVHTDEIRRKMRDEDSKFQNPIIHSSFLQANTFSTAPGMAAYWEGWIKQSEAVMTGVAPIVRKHFDEGKNVLCEGIHLVPPFYQSFLPKEKIVHINLISGGEKTLKTRLAIRGRLGNDTNANDAEKIQNIHILEEFEKFLLTCSESCKNPGKDIFLSELIAASKRPIIKVQSITKDEK